MYHFKRFLQTLVFIGIGWAHAGSYEDFFQATETNDAAKLTLLLQRGFDANTPGPQGQTGLLTAIRQNATQAALVLANWPETRIDLRTADDETALMLAAFHNLMPVARVLVQRDADVNKLGWTPLHYAATKANIEMIRYLLENHAFIDAPSPNGTTPLMMAAHYGSALATKILLEEGADPRIKNQLGLSALDFAQNGPQAKEATEYLNAFLSSWNARYPVKP